MPRAATALHAPLDLPPDRLALVVGALDEPALLEGGPGFGSAGRWSHYTARPALVFAFDGHAWSTRRGGQAGDSGRSDALAALGDLLDAYHLADASEEPPDPDGPPFRGGLIGYLGYDIAPLLEHLPRKAPGDSRLPVIRFGLYDWAASVDHQTGAVILSVFDLDGQGSLPARLRDLERQLMRAIPARVAARPARPIEAPRSDFEKGAYLAAVERALEYIRAGDIFQVNLSQRFRARGDFDPLDLYRRLRAVSPAPFSALLRWEDGAVVSSSPEWFYRTRGDRIVTRPIKGTRPRGATPAEDARLAGALRQSPKDRAELTMIVDLERNDLGRVCRYGSVRVTEPLAVESYAQVHHLVATVEGRLRPECGPIDVVRAMMPGGSITGAPKIRAMEIIDELEPSRRGVYTGAIGYFTRGASAFNIAIRTILVEGDRASYQVGGGIVADSVPEHEYEETLHKGRGMRAVLEGAGA